MAPLSTVPTDPCVTPAGAMSSSPTGAEIRCRVMGTTAHVLLHGTDLDAAEAVSARLHDLERRWSRFRDESELSRLNGAAGRPSVVGVETADLIERSVWAWRRTGGLFDPTVLAAVRAAGYDRSFDELAGRTTIAARPGLPAPGAAAITVDRATGLVELPSGVGLDPGGIGKGLAADLCATAAVDAGADAALVSVGGDLRVAGTPPEHGWEVEIDHHVVAPARLNLHQGALATSSTLRRRWSTDSGTAHHVIDPRTGRPTDGPVVAVSVVAGQAWWAEALATALLVAGGPEGPGVDGAEIDWPDLLADTGALLTHAEGTQRVVGALADSFALPGRTR
jgi:thiamine biosynthesis lipoprotein